MSNDEILNQRWAITDKTLKDYLNKFDELGEEIIDNLIDMFDTIDIAYNDLNKPISKTENKKIDRKIQEWKDNGLLIGYFEYLVRSKGKLTYSDLIEILIYGIYAEQESKIKKQSKKVFTKVAKDIYSQALDEVPVKPKKEFSLTWEYIWSLLWIPTYNKSWDDYLKLLTLTDYQETYKQVLGVIQQDKQLTRDMLKDLVKKQTNRIISINDDKYSGALSDTCRQLGNKIYTEPFKEQKDLQVRFIAEMDERTTKMCKSMNNKLFYVNDWNRFYRYSALDDREVLYTVKGLETGINLPPVNNHFHWCRSTITYNLNKNIRKKYKNTTSEWIREHNKTLIRYEPLQYKKGDKFIFRGNYYEFDNDLIYYDFSHGELEFANWLSNKIDKKIRMFPNIDINGGVSAPDYIINGYDYDLKRLEASNHSKQPVFHALQNKSKQSSRFFIDASLTSHQFEDLVYEVYQIYERDKLNWVEMIGIRKNEDFIIISKK